VSLSDLAPHMRDPDPPSEASINDWGHRVSDARARITSEIRRVDDASPLRREGKLLLDELTLAFEELQVAEEELHVQTEELSASRMALHVACDDANFERISDVRQIAVRQGAWIDTHRPEHRLSSSSAKARGRNSMFAMLERQAEAAAHIDLSARPRWKRP